MTLALAEAVKNTRSAVAEMLDIQSKSPCIMIIWGILISPSAVCHTAPKKYP